MMLKNIMEDKQLDFNRPFRSVRTRPITPRVAPECKDSTKTDNSIPRIPTLPAYKPEIKSGPIRNPGTVPFQWEKSPGRPKNEGKSQSRPPVAPKLPPGRIVNAQQQSSDKGSVDLENVTKRDSAKPETEDEEGFESEDDYVDARDTLSRTESSLLNCSVSGLSGFDGPYVKPFGAFSDPQARDFMMGRFLPAAKAMASESPHYSTRKQPVARELPPRRVDMIATVDKRQDCATGVEAEESEDDSDSDSDSDDEPEYPSSKACGLIPQFCLLSPVPGLRQQARPVKKPDGSSLYKRLQGRAAPSSPNNPSARSQKNLREILACKSNDWDAESAIPVAEEKTLYIDSMNFSKPSDSRNDPEVLEKEEASFAYSCPDDVKEMDGVGDPRQGRDLVQVSKMSEDARNHTKELTYLPLPPPLPKSPSESWLSRALTTAASSRNHRSSPDTYSYNRSHASKASPLDPKWETIVKTSNTHNERLRFSEELLAPIPEA